MKIKLGAFLKFCRDNHLIPYMFNIESLQENLWASIPPISQEEYQYFDQNRLIKLYEDSGTKDYRYVPNWEEPEMHFHEFVFILGRIAKSVTIADSDDPSIQEKI